MPDLLPPRHIPTLPKCSNPDRGKGTGGPLYSAAPNQPENFMGRGEGEFGRSSEKLAREAEQLELASRRWKPTRRSDW
jgi:hypothetical protein